MVYSKPSPTTDPGDGKQKYWSMPRVITGVLLAAILTPMIAYGVVRVNYLLQASGFARMVGGEGKADAPPRRGSALDYFNTENLLVSKDSIGSGGPPKDGIPSLTRPDLAPAEKINFLREEDRVIAVTVQGETRGYPIAILNLHEAVNDELGGIPLGVFYCPLCDSVSVVDRRMGESTLEFGISGLLINSNVLLYDRTDDALWSQVGLRAISGPHAGKSLKHLGGWSIMSFGSFREEFPAARIMTQDTGHSRSYGRNPYRKYFTNDSLYFPVVGSDGPFVNKTPVIGVKYGDKTRAFVVADIARAEGGTVRETTPGGVLELRVNEDGSVVVESLPEGAQAVHTFWFAWSAFHPDTEVVGELPRKTIRGPTTQPDEPGD